MPAEQLPARVLQECHAPLRGTMNRLAATVTLPDGSELRAFAKLPALLRIASPGGQFLLRDDTCYRIDAPVGPAPAAALERMQALRDLLDAAAFGPLHRATGCTATATAGDYAITVPEATPVRLMMRPQTLLPAAFVFGAARVDVLDYLRTPSTWIAKRLHHPALGDCVVRFEVSDVEFEESVFAPPGAAREGGAPPQMRMPAEAIERRSSVPILADTKPVRWVVLDDPGDWASRTALYAPWDACLQGLGQVIAGFPILTELDGRPVLAVPFRARKGQSDSNLRLREGTRELAFGAGLELFVFPPQGDLPTRRADGERMLREVAAAQGLVPEGSVRCQVYVHLEDGVPTAEALQSPTVRMSFRVNRR